MTGVVVAYLVGSIPFGWILPSLVRGIDIRDHGSGNPGATNVGRVMGKGWGITVAVLDGLKGWCAVDLAIRAFGADDWTRVGCALAAVAGHVWPAWIGFRGGKGVITTAGAFCRLAPGPIAAAALTFGIVAGATRMISAGSVAAAVVFPVLAACWSPVPVRIAAIVSGALVIWRHRANLARIRRGTEPRFSAGKRRRR